MTRFITIKGEQAEIAKRELLILWTDYFKPPHLEASPDLHDKFWKAAKLCSSCKQEISMQAGDQRGALRRADAGDRGDPQDLLGDEEARGRLVCRQLMLHLLARALGRRKRFRVAGESMAPGLRDGDPVWVDPRAYRASAPRPGDVVLARHPFKRSVRMIKRVADVGPDRCTLIGDNPTESTDNRTFGAVPLSRILGKVVWTRACRT